MSETLVLKQVIELRKRGEFTTPSTLESELQVNPFLRCNSPEIQKMIKQRDPANDLEQWIRIIIEDNIISQSIEIWI